MVSAWFTPRRRSRDVFRVTVSVHRVTGARVVFQQRIFKLPRRHPELAAQQAAGQAANQQEVGWTGGVGRWPLAVGRRAQMGLRPAGQRGRRAGRGSIGISGQALRRSVGSRTGQWAEVRGDSSTGSQATCWNPSG
jgi:hypothetical protein